ncbi:FAD binding domain-containing protein [Amylocarpus encephaloides]|uniref:FAD binding domain-containing protein n=1 Tax=Amylocarpus encephaloides TaxID=45428 RepID=A0A9P7YT60_9HELO|nr:FAD binding domain-containing protein [Amylocarpus encephaloides]
MKRTHSQVSPTMCPSAANDSLPNEFTNGHGTAVNGSTGTENVIIVGAGPAGLMLASNLTRYGIKPCIVDDRSDKTSTGRADGLQPKTIETFKQLGLANPLLQKGVKIFDICFWNSTPSTPLQRTRREVHYPPGVDVIEPFILLVHQGMVEDIFIEDLRERGVEVMRSRPFSRYSMGQDLKDPIKIVCDNTINGSEESLKAKYLVGCDGARSKVRSSIPSAELVGDSTRAPWGVLDGVIETDFPDLWSKVVIHSEEKGTILCIPRERNMTRLYIELNPRMAEALSNDAATQDFVIKRAQEIIAPFTLKWESIEWFSVYKVGQRVANRFTDDEEKVFITGDAAHTHSPKAAQGMNTSMHDSFNLSWKLNLAIRGLALPSLLSTYTHERRKIAQDLINFDFEHANAFADGDSKALAANFAANIAFISGLGATYAPNILNIECLNAGGCLQPGALLLPARVTRYIDANPVDLQLDIPMLGQFRTCFFTANPHHSYGFLSTISLHLTSTNSVLGRASKAAEISYETMSTKSPESDEFMQPQRYIAVSRLFTPALVTTIKKEEIEISDLPSMFRESCWTFYLDDLTSERQSCTDKWLGAVEEGQVTLVNIRPDGYVGAIETWDNGQGKQACEYLDAYYGGFLKG